VREVEGEEEALDYAGVFYRGKAVDISCRREAEPWVVQRDAPEPVAQSLDDLPIDEGSGEIAVQEQQRRSLAFVEVMDPAAV
jgi:hypothetical protein